MRIVILAPSVYSETACAMAAHLAESGYVPIAALAISALQPKTLLRKIGQWGIGASSRYAFAKLIPQHRAQSVQNPYLEPMLRRGAAMFRSLSEVAAHYRFPLAVCNDMNSPGSVARLTQWSPDLIIFAGGNILRRSVLKVPRLGILNVHLGLLPEVRGMSTPEWSLLENVPAGITLHYMDAGIDTGPILKKYEFLHTKECDSLRELRHRLVAFGVEKTVSVIASLDRREISAEPQSSPDPDREKDKDRQFFVMHDWLRARAAESFAQHRSTSGMAHG
jgi:methionyl-tRNA formyltransferase